MTSISPHEISDPARPVDPLEVMAASPNVWRVRREGGPVVGVVQAIGDTFEVMQVGMPLARSYFGSLEDAVDSLADS